MRQGTFSLKGIVVIFAAIVAVFALSYFYVLFLETGWRAIVVVFGGGFLFLFSALCLKDLRTFLLFTLIFVIPLQFGYHLIHHPLVGIESQPFSSGIAIDIVDVVLILLYGHWLLTLSVGNNGVQQFTMGGKLGGLFLTWIVYVFTVSFFTATNFSYSVFEVIILVKGYLIFLYLINTVHSLKDFKTIIYASFAGSMAHAFYIFGQFITQKNYTLHGELVMHLGPEGFRSVGFFGSPDAASVLLTLVFPIAVAYYMVIGNSAQRRWTAVCLALVLVAIAFTKVRAAGIALIVSTGVLMLVSYKRGWVPSVTLGKAAFLVLAIIAIASPFIIARFQSGTWGEDRLPLAATAWNMIQDHWIWGVGANNYPLDIMQYVPVSFRHAWAYTVHNEYLLRLSETGIFGALLFYTLLFAMMLRLFRLTQSPNPWIFAVSAGLFAALVGSIPHRMLSFYHYVNVFWQTSVILALIHFMDQFERTRILKHGGEASLTQSRRKILNMSPQRIHLFTLVIFILFVGVFIKPFSVLAKNYYVDVNRGADSNEGTSAQPLKTIKKASQVMTAGDTALIREGVYHEQIIGGNSGLPGKPITYEGVDRDKVVMQGSIKIDNWISLGKVWISKGLNPITPENAFVMIDEKRMLRRAEVPDNLPEDSFYLSDSGVYHIRLEGAANPNSDHLVEVYELDCGFNSGDRWNGTAKQWITLRNLTMEKYGTNAVSTDAHNPRDNSHWELDNLTIRYNNAEGVFHCLDHWLVHNCQFIRNRGHGCQLNGAETIFTKNYCAENEWFGYYQDGGCGILIGPDQSAFSCAILDNVFKNNGAKNGFGCGIYLEGLCRSNLISRNKIIGGTAAGLALYGSIGNRIFNNVLIDVARNSKLDFAAAFIIGKSQEKDGSFAMDNVIAHNTIWNCPAPVFAEPTTTSEAPRQNRFINNLFVNCRTLLPLPKVSTVDFKGNGWKSCPAIPNGTVALRAWLRGADDHGPILGAGEVPEFVDSDHHNFRLKAGSPLTHAGVPFTELSSDMAGVRRPINKDPSIGAFEPQ